jgi:hypothetical protein
MTLADLFDDRLWETYEVDAVPKRGGKVERRRYIGGGGGQNVPVYDPSGSSTAPEYRSDGYRHEDHLAERFRNRDTGGPVTLFPVDSLDKQDMLDVAGRDYGIHGSTVPDYDQPPPVPVPSWWDQASEFGTDAWKDWGAPAWESVGRGWDWANQPLAEPTGFSDKAIAAHEAGEPIIPSTAVGTADRMILDGIIDNIQNPFVSSNIKEEFARERARYQELLKQGMDKSTAAITAAREFGRETGQTIAERSADKKRAAESAEKFDLIRFLQGLGSAYLGNRL